MATIDKNRRRQRLEAEQRGRQTAQSTHRSGQRNGRSTEWDDLLFVLLSVFVGITLIIQTAIKVNDDNWWGWLFKAEVNRGMEILSIVVGTILFAWIFSGLFASQGGEVGRALAGLFKKNEATSGARPTETTDGGRRASDTTAREELRVEKFHAAVSWLSFLRDITGLSFGKR